MDESVDGEVAFHRDYKRIARYHQELHAEHMWRLVECSDAVNERGQRLGLCPRHRVRRKPRANCANDLHASRQLRGKIRGFGDAVF